MLESLRGGQRWITAVIIGSVALVFVLFLGFQGPLTAGSSGSDPVYVAFLLGDLEAGEDYQMPIEYLLGQKLKKGKNAAGEKVFMFPRYAYAVVSVSSVPEPSTLALLALGAATVGLAARRAR